MSLEFRNAPVRDEYKSVLNALKPMLHDLPHKIISIDGRAGVGKTTLGRFLAWRFNITLIETDNLIEDSKDGISYNMNAISQIIQRRERSDRPVIIEGVLTLRILKLLDKSSDFRIHVICKEAEGSSVLDSEAERYETEFAPRKNSDLIVELPALE